MKSCTLALLALVHVTLVDLVACKGPGDAASNTVTTSGCAGAYPQESSTTPSAAAEPEVAADAVLVRARATFDAARAAQVGGDPAEARARASEAIEILLSADGREDDGEWIALLFDLGTFAHEAGDLRSAEKASRRVVEVRTRRLSAEHADLQAARQNLAATMRALGDLAGARALQELVLDVRTRSVPPDHPALQAARLNLAATMYSQGDLAGARSMFEQVLESYARTLPPDHPDLQKARQNLAVTIKALGDLAAARALEEQVLEVRARTLPADHPDLQSARQNLAVTIQALGDLAGARTLFEQVLEVRARTLPPEHPDLQKARLNLGATLLSLGELAVTRTLFEQVVEVFSRTLPPDHPDLQRARMNLAITMRALGELAIARDLAEQVLEVRARTLPLDHPDLQMARLNVSVILRELGDLAGARTLMEQLLEACVRTLPPDHPDLQKARQNLATTMYSLGDLAGARTLFEQVLEVRARTFPLDHPDLQAARQNLATTIRTLGDLAGARALEEQVLEARERMLPPDHPELQVARQNLAVTIHLMGDAASARVLEEQVLEVRARTLPPDHPDLQAARQNLAVTIRNLGDIAGARALEEQVLEVRARTLPADHPDLQAVRQNLAVTSLASGDLAGARALEEKVLEARARTLPPDHPDLQKSRSNLAATIAAQSARTRGVEGEGPKVWELAKERCATLLLELSRTQGSAARVVLMSAPSREAEERCVQLAAQLDRCISFAQGYGVFDPSPALAHASFVLSETTRASGLVAARLARVARSDPRYQGLSQAIRSASEELARLAQSGGTREAFDASVRRRDDAQRELVMLASQSSDTAGLVIEPDPAVLSGRLEEGVVVVAYRQYKRSEIPDGETRERSTESLCAFVLRKDAELALVDLGAIEPIEAAVGDWRDALGVAAGRGLAVEDPAAGRPEERVLAARIRERVFDPLMPHLEAARRVVVVLDDVLQSVPIDALPAKASEGSSGSASSGTSSAHLLGERFEIKLRSATQELLADAPTPGGASLVVLVGGADYDAAPRESSSDAESVPLANVAETPTSAVTEAHASKSAVGLNLLRGGAWGEGFAPLPGTSAEARGLDALARRIADGPDVVRLEHAAASRASIEALAPKARFLHLATHGWFAPESVRSWSDPDPLDGRGNALMRMSSEERVRGASPMVLCGLALAGANLPADAIGRFPGLVTAEEISGWDLGNCELAVLSACDTNVGLRKAGQGVASLQKALHMAGARTVITSLWKVPDEATKDLMLDFYRRIWVEKTPKRRALWEAKMRLRDAKDERGAPKHSTRDWAAWVLTGDPL